MVGFEKVCFFNNLYERRGRSEVDGGLSRNFTESVGAYLELPGLMSFVYGVPRQACKVMLEAFEERILRPITDLFVDDQG